MCPKVAILVSELLERRLDRLLCVEPAMIGAKPYFVPPESDSSRSTLELYAVISCEIGSERRHDRRFADHNSVPCRSAADLLLGDYALSPLVNRCLSRPPFFPTLEYC